MTAPANMTPVETAEYVRLCQRAKARHLHNVAHSTSDELAEDRRRVLAGTQLWAQFSIHMKQFAFYVAQGRIPTSVRQFERMLDAGLIPRGAVLEGAYGEYEGPPDFR